MNTKDKCKSMAFKTFLYSSIAVVSFFSSANAEIYQWKDEKGKIHFSDKSQAPKNVIPIELKDTNSSDAVTSRTPFVGTPENEFPEEEQPTFDVNGASSSLDCFDKSQAFKTEGDDYFEVEHIKIDKNTREILESLYDSIDDEWEGRSRETICKGTDKAPKEEIRLSSAEVKVRQSTSNSIRFEIHREYKDERGPQSEVLRLFRKDALTEIEAEDNYIIAVEKYREKLKKGSRLRETQIYLQYSQTELSINITYYMNGVYISQQSIRLVR
ncbi:hypothetical protein R50073_47050 [Maricurvus nonylphenolicus]|uniref:DUF4124 domain-containing protein n=1 Tax=Maricurvus nonylphenolicus TaxID=1008307 RepID=UPI0036F1CE77